MEHLFGVVVLGELALQVHHEVLGAVHEHHVLGLELLDEVRRLRVVRVRGEKEMASEGIARNQKHTERIEGNPKHSEAITCA